MNLPVSRNARSKMSSGFLVVADLANQQDRYARFIELH